MANKYVQSLTQYLAGNGVIIGATTVVLQSLTDIYGNVLTMTDFGAKGYITLEPDTTNEELATFTGVVANANGTYSLTGVSTALAKSPYTETSGLVRAHAGGTKVVVTDNVAFWNTFANKANDETITGRWGSATVPSANSDYVNKLYADGLAIAGAPNSSTTVKGIGEVSVAPVSPTTPIFVGDNDPRVPTIAQTAAMVGNNTDIAVGSGNKVVTQTGLQHNAEKYAADTSGSSTAYVVTLSPVPTSYTTGMVVYAKIVNANTTTTPTLNVNGLGAKTIVKANSVALVAGDIAANMLCTFIYDGTNLVLQNPSANVALGLFKTGVTTYNLATASGAQTIAHGLGVIPKYIKTIANVQRTGGGSSVIADYTPFSFGSYNGSTIAQIFNSQDGSNDQVIAGTQLNGAIISYSLLGGTNATQAVPTFDATNITLTWTKVGSPTGTLAIYWEAYA